MQGFNRRERESRCAEMGGIDKEWVQAHETGVGRAAHAPGRRGQADVPGIGTLSGQTARHLAPPGAGGGGCAARSGLRCAVGITVIRMQPGFIPNARP